jgi:hypothetical protein
MQSGFHTEQKDQLLKRYDAENETLLTIINSKDNDYGIDHIQTECLQKQP